MDSTLDVRTLDPRFKTGLIFSLYEGLLKGRSLKLISDQDPIEIQNQFIMAHVENIHWRVHQLAPAVWQIELSKLEHQPEQKEGCGGLCGTHGG